MFEVAIDKSLSVYHMLERRLTDQQSIVNHRRTMNLISYEIENATLIDGVRGRIFSSFQRMSSFIPQIPRYTQLAAKAESVYVFGVPDVQVPAIPNLRYIPLPADAQLTREWFVILEAPNYHSVLATEELTEPNTRDHERMFHGVWTFNAEITTILQEWMSSLVDAQPLESLVGSQSLENETHYLSNTLNRLAKRFTRDLNTSKPLDQAIAKEAQNSARSTGTAFRLTNSHFDV